MTSKEGQMAMSSRKGKGTANVVDQICDGVGAVTLDSTYDGTWKDVVKSKNRGGSSNNNKAWGQQNTAPSAWGKPASRKVVLQSSSRGFPTNVAPRPPANAAPLERGWNWKGRASTQGGVGSNETQHVVSLPIEDDETDNDDDSFPCDSDDEMLSDDFDSDVSNQSFESRKKNKWLKTFFDMLDKLTIEEINEPARQWHCPACQGGPGAIDWYRGLQPLMTHAKTKGSIRVKIHRELAELLDEELRTRGTSVVSAGEAFGAWNALMNVKDREIVWPPMVVIMNTRLDKDDKDKWVGMGNQELLDYFRQYAALKARHAYNAQGHRGMSMLIFESSAVGYLEAFRLHEHFKEQGSDKEAWNSRRVLFYAGGNRQLYGYLAEKQDLDFFNQSHSGKAKLKYELRSYAEMVVSQLRQMNEDNQQLVFYKDKVVKEQQHSKALEQSNRLMSEKMRRTSEEVHIVRQRSKAHGQQNKEEMDFQENFFKSQLQNIHAAREAKEDNFERLQQEERQKVKQSKARREDEVANFISSQDKDMEEFVGERDAILKTYEEKKAAMKQMQYEEEVELKQRQYKEEVELEEEVDAQLNQLMAKYNPNHPQSKV